MAFDASRCRDCLLFWRCVGIPSVSQFDRIVTAALASRQQDRKPMPTEMAAETITGEPIDSLNSLRCSKVTPLRPSQRHVQPDYGNEVQQVGMVFQDEVGAMGALAGWDNPRLGRRTISADLNSRQSKSNTLVEYLYTGGIPAKYRPQVYGSLYVSGLHWWDFAACSPVCPRTSSESRTRTMDTLNMPMR